MARQITKTIAKTTKGGARITKTINKLKGFGKKRLIQSNKYAGVNSIKDEGLRAKALANIVNQEAAVQKAAIHEANRTTRSTSRSGAIIGTLAPMFKSSQASKQGGTMTKTDPTIDRLIDPSTPTPKSRDEDGDPEVWG